jgi:DNA-binding transcriptional regulator GbsR (MarR family)
MKNKPIHYVNNRDFSNAVVIYCTELQEKRDRGESLPIVPDYIAQCFLNISERLSRKSNFIMYTYREEMVMDAVENCLKAIENYNIEAATRTGKPNAFAYFTQISWYAFLRRIAKEKKQHDVKEKYIATISVEAMVGGTDESSQQVVQQFVDKLKSRIDKVKEVDTEIKEFSKREKLRKKNVPKIGDSDLTDYFGG